jgi:uncharacterized protein YyaL (SSP411 family)
VEPSGNSAAAWACLRLHAYGVREGFLDDALRIFSSFREHMGKAGVSFAAMLGALDFHLSPPREVAVVGDPAAADTKALLAVLDRRYQPDAVTAFAAPANVAALGQRIPLLASRQASAGKATAYVCSDMACRLPVHTPGELERELQ